MQLKCRLTHVITIMVRFFLSWCNSSSGPRLPHGRGFTITLTHTPQSVWLLWTSDQPDARTSTWQYTTLTTDIHAPGAIRTQNPSKRAAADPLLRPRGHGTGDHDSLKPLKSECFILYTIQNYGQVISMHHVGSKHHYLTFLQTKSPAIRFHLLRVPALNEYAVWTHYIAHWMQYWHNPKTAVWS
jgi:hypothetical protein